MTSRRSDPRGRKTHAKQVFAVVFGLAVILLIVPIHWTGPVERICQAFLAPAGRYAILAAQTVTRREGPSQGPAGGLSDEQTRRMVAVLNQRITELERENRKLLSLRRTLDAGFALAPANVVAHDSMGLASVVIDRGAGVTSDNKSIGGTAAGDPVLVAVAEGIPAWARVDPKLVLATGALIGRIAPYAPGPYTSRAELLPGIDTPFACCILRVDQASQQVHVIVKNVVVTGKDGTVLVADKVPGEHNVQMGDLVVLTEPQDFNLPISLAVGKVADIQTRTDNRLFVDLTIQPYFTAAELGRVYVLVGRGVRP